jgi:hypothetical protein
MSFGQEAPRRFFKAPFSFNPLLKKPEKRENDAEQDSPGWT